MIKKTMFLCLAVAGSLLLPVTANCETTNRVGLVDFCELYTERYITVQKKRGIEDNRMGMNFGVLANAGDFLFVSTTAGEVNVCKDTLEITEATFTLFDLDADSATNDRHSMSFVSALSALEFDCLDERQISLDSVLHGGPKDAFEKSVGIYNDEIFDIVNNYDVSKARSGDRVLVYSGNYDYYLEYQSYAVEGRSNTEFWIIACEHK